MPFRASVYDITSGLLPSRDDSYKGTQKILGPDDYLLRFAVQSEKKSIYVDKVEKRKRRAQNANNKGKGKGKSKIKISSNSKSKSKSKDPEEGPQPSSESDHSDSADSDESSEPPDSPGSWSHMPQSRLDDSVEQRILPNGIPVYEHEDLPDSDLLKALHAYTAEYHKYHGRYKPFGNFDPTSLLAFGVLAEELVNEVLGDDGNLMYIAEE